MLCKLMNNGEQVLAAMLQGEVNAAVSSVVDAIKDSSSRKAPTANGDGDGNGDGAAYCPDGHLLTVVFYAYTTNIACDVCEDDGSFRSYSMQEWRSCRQCDYDICQSCHKESANELPDFSDDSDIAGEPAIIGVCMPDYPPTVPSNMDDWTREQVGCFPAFFPPLFISISLSPPCSSPPLFLSASLHIPSCFPPSHHVDV